LKGENTWHEIQSQAQTWEAALCHAAEARHSLLAHLSPGNYTEAIFVGCGSTHYLSLTASRLCNELLGMRARGLPSSEVFLFPRQTLPRSGRPLMVAVSRSGETTETIRAVETFKRHFSAAAITVGNYPGSSLVKACDVAVLIPEAQEKSIAQTRSFSSMLVALQSVLGADDQEHLASLQHLPKACSALMATHTQPMKDLGATDKYNTFIFLGSGPYYGLACEGMLKMKEMSLSHSEAFHYMEFRHGPKSIVNERTLIVALLSDSGRNEELRLLHEVRGLGASVLLIGDQLPADPPADYVVEFDANLGESVRLPLCLPPMQVLAYSRAVTKGLDPDQPTHLDAVVTL